MPENIDVSVIVPTYNERDNVNILFDRIDKSLANINYEIIVVDDNSPDGTGKVVEELSNKYPAKLITRKNNKGLATAVVEGFKYAKGDIYAVIDADLQHPPEKLTSLIWETQNGTDIAIGSRYVETNEKGFGEFSTTRKMISKGANTLAKLLVPKLSKINDIQSGFFAIKKNVIKDVDLNPIGYKILLEILAVGHYKNVKEVPFIFGKRDHGESKLGTNVIFEYIRHLLTIFWKEKETKRILKFIITGLMGIVFSVGFLWFLTEVTGIFYVTSGIISKEAGTLFSFALSEMWVFKDRIEISLKGSLKRCIQFNLNRFASISVVIIVMAVLTEYLGIHYIISNLIGILIAFPLNYVASNSLIWKIDSVDK